MVGIENQCMWRYKGKRILILLLCLNLIRRAKLLHHSGIQSHTFLHFRRNDKTFPLKLCHLRLHISLAIHGQGFRWKLSCIISKYSENGIPEGTLTIGTATISNNHVLLINLTDCSHANRLLHIINQFLILAEEKIQGIQPYLFPILSRRTRSNLCNQILRIMRQVPCKPFSKVIGCIRCVNQILVFIQIRHGDSNHRLCRICCRHDIFVIASLLHKFQISLGSHQHINQRNKLSIHLF